MKHDNQKITVLKIGGKVLDNETELHCLLTAFSAITSYKILVHGGGVKVDQMLQQLGIKKIISMVDVLQTQRRLML